MAADAAAAKEKEERAERFKKQIRENDAEFLDEYMEFGREKQPGVATRCSR